MSRKRSVAPGCASLQAKAWAHLSHPAQLSLTKTVRPNGLRSLRRGHRTTTARNRVVEPNVAATCSIVAVGAVGPRAVVAPTAALVSLAPRLPEAPISVAADTLAGAAHHSGCSPRSLPPLPRQHPCQPARDVQPRPRATHAQSTATILSRPLDLYEPGLPMGLP